jgi:hypothetical protein
MKNHELPIETDVEIEVVGDRQPFVQRLGDFGRKLKDRLWGERAAGERQVEAGTELSEEKQVGIEAEPLEEIGEERAREILAETEFDVAPGEQQLTGRALGEIGLRPRYETALEGRKMAFSSAYNVDSREAVMAYVWDDESKPVARSFYRSNSQGVWRYLPDYETDENGNVTRYGKGMTEDSVTLPIELQKTLNQIERDGNKRLHTEVDPEQIMVATARRYGDETGDYYDEGVQEAEFEVRADASGPVKEAQWPDFAKRIDNYEMDTDIYGRVTVSVYPSKDGELKYAFNRDEMGRSWISQIDINASVTATGVRQEYVDGGMLTTPAMEYESQANGYGNAAITKGSYLDMYTNLLSKMEVIQKFEKAQADQETGAAETTLLERAA